MLSAKGVVWTGGAIALLVLGVGFTSLPAALLGAALLVHVSLAWALLGHPNVSGTLTIERDQVTEGDRVPITATLENGSRRALTVQARIDLPGTFAEAEGLAAASLMLAGGATHQLAFVTRPALHGAYQVGPVRLLLQDPAALVLEETEVVAAKRLLVKPRVEVIRDLPLLSKLVTPFIGLHEIQQPGDGFEFYTLRSYHPGDSIRSINWRASARTEGLIVNQRVRESFASVTVVLDARAGEGLGIRRHAPWYRGARAAATLAEAFMKARDQVTFHVVSDRVETIRPHAPERQRRAILETLAATRPHGHSELRELVSRLLPTLRSRSLFILVSSLETEDGVGHMLRTLGVRDIRLLVVSPGSRWHDEVPEVVREGLARRERELSSARTSGALVVDLPPDRLVTVALQEAMRE